MLEDAEIIPADALANPRAVVVVLMDADVAAVAVNRSQGAHDSAWNAVPVIIFGLFRRL